MKIILAQYDNFVKQSYELVLKEQSGEMTRREFCLQSDGILEKILRFDNVYTYDSFEDFKLAFSTSISEGYRESGTVLPTSWMDFVLGQAHHEREHTDVSLRYGLKPTYCFVHDDSKAPGDWQPFNYIKDMDILDKKWDEYTRFKYQIETTSAPRDLSPGDKDYLRILDGIVRVNKEIDIRQKRELLDMVSVGLRK